MKRKLRSVSWVIVALVCAMVAAGCSATENTTTTPAGSDSTTTTQASSTTSTTADEPTSSTLDQPTATLIAFASPEDATDYGWNQQGLEGAQKVAAEVGAQLEAADGIGYTDVAPVLRQLASQGPDLLIAHASGYRNVGPEVALETGVPTLVFNNPEALEAGVVANIDQQSFEGGYLAGVLAALMSKTGTLGIAQSADVSTWNRMSGGFVQGARAVNPDILIRVAIIGEGGFSDVAGGKRITEQLIGGGADVIFGMGDGSSFGMIQGVETAPPPAGADKVWFIDVIGNKTELDTHGIYLSSVLFDFSYIFRAAIADLNAGTFGTHSYEVSLKSGALQLLQTSHVPNDVWAQVEEYREQILAGSLTVDDLTTLEEVQNLISGR